MLAIVVHLAVEMPFVRLKRGEKYEQLVDDKKKSDDEDSGDKEIEEKTEAEKKTE